MRLTSDEAGAVAVGGRVVPGARRPGARGPRLSVAVPTTAVRFVDGGDVRLKLTLGRSARQALARLSDARLRLTVIATDLGGNARGRRVSLQLFR